MNISRRLLVPTGLGVLIGLLTVACSSTPAPRARDDARPPIPVTTAQVAMTDLTETFEAGGVVQAKSAATLTARILAPVVAVRAAPGERVRQGQVLITLDGRDLGARARSAQAAAIGSEHSARAAAAEASGADASLTFARATHARIEALLDKRSATPQELDEATANLRLAEARAAGAAARVQEAASGVDGAKSASEAARATESFTQITAPFDGVVTEKLVEPGNTATPGMPLLRIEDTREFRLDVRVDESRIGGVTLGAAVLVLLDAGTGDPAGTVRGTVSEIARSVDADARAFLVKITLPEIVGLRSGMFGRARFTGSSRRALTLPPAAVIRRGQVTSVFVVDKGVARLRMVDVAGAEVLAGLVESETVVVGPAADLVDGRHVSAGGR